MGKIIASELLEMIDAGKTGIECAAHFSVSSAAISKALAKLRPKSPPASFEKLTSDKVRRYALERSLGKSKTDSAQTAFQCDRKSAATIGSRLDKDPDVSASIQDLLYQANCGRRRRVERLVDVIESKNLSEAIRGIELAAKMTGELTERLEIGHSTIDIRMLIASIDTSAP